MLVIRIKTVSFEKKGERSSLLSGVIEAFFLVRPICVKKLSLYRVRTNTNFERETCVSSLSSAVVDHVGTSPEYG